MVIEGALPHAPLLDSVHLSEDSEEGAKEGDREWAVVAGSGSDGGRATGTRQRRQRRRGEGDRHFFFTFFLIIRISDGSD